MKIEALTTFLDGRERFEQGDIRTVDDGRGTRLVAAGWARDVSGDVPTGPAASGPADLEIHNAVMGQEARHG